MSAEGQDMTTPRAKGIGRIPQVISHRFGAQQSSPPSSRAGGGQPAKWHHSAAPM